MNEERFWLLVSLKLSGEAGAAELKELETLLKQHPEMGLRIETLNGIWNSQAAAENADWSETAFNRHMQRLSNHLAEPALQFENNDTAGPVLKPIGIRKKIFWAAGIAASILVIWLTTVHLPARNNQAKHSVAQNTVSTKRGSKSKIQLPDGTQVWLNADSKITYNENFQGIIREVQLSGEAFFDVARDESRPFVIHTNEIDLKVLGTAFNVRSYADEKNTETALIHGSVEITLRNSPDKKIILKPNEKLIVRNGDMQLLTEKPDKRAEKQPLLTLGKINYQKKDSSAMETLWVRNKLAFDNETVEEIAQKLERWYDVKVTIADEELRKVRYSGIFEDENLQQVMEALQLAGIKSSINRKEVVLRQ
jgi:transmembrane sensor